MGSHTEDSGLCDIMGKDKKDRSEEFDFSPSPDLQPHRDTGGASSQYPEFMLAGVNRKCKSKNSSRLPCKKMKE